MTNEQQFQPDVRPVRVIHSVAPIRICDNGGWTDTWFAAHGAVCNIAVLPGAEVDIAVYPRASRRDGVMLNARNYSETFVLAPEVAVPLKHKLLAAAVCEVPPPADVAIEVHIYSEVPPGCSTGTSAAVCVALLAALVRLNRGQISAWELARAAHRVETERLGFQSGIQDQYCAAFGGINFIEMHAYPAATVSQLSLPNDLLWELERRMMLVYLGHTHSSSAVHEKVIAKLTHDGAQSAQLERLRNAARTSRDALVACDLNTFGQLMSECTAAQADLHPELVSRDAWKVIDTARNCGAAGWKVNGAGGEGGSITILCGDTPDAMRELRTALTLVDRGFQVVPIRMSSLGARVWESS